MEPKSETKKGAFNEHQKRRLLVTCQYIDKLLADIEAILNTPASKAAFPRYASNLTPAQRSAIEDYIAQIRAQLLRVLDEQAIPREPASIPASRAIRADLGVIDIALLELNPRYMRGYGPVPEEASRNVDTVVRELRDLVGRLDRFVLERAGQDDPMPAGDGRDVSPRSSKK